MNCSSEVFELLEEFKRITSCALLQSKVPSEVLKDLADFMTGFQYWAFFHHMIDPGKTRLSRILMDEFYDPEFVEQRDNGLRCFIRDPEAQKRCPLEILYFIGKALKMRYGVEYIRTILCEAQGYMKCMLTELLDDKQTKLKKLADAVVKNPSLENLMALYELLNSM